MTKYSLLDGFTSKELSEKIDKSEKTLSRWRYTGEGPRFVRIGQTIFYPTQYLEEYYAERTAASTCEEAARLDQRRKKTNGR